MNNKEEIIEYRHTGLSFNHILGCPLNCSYCVRHFWNNFENKEPYMLIDDDNAIKTLINHKWFVKDLTPIEFLHKGTDPFLPNVKNHMFYVLQKLDSLGFKNIIVLITRYLISREDIQVLENLKSLKIAILFTYSGIDNPVIEPITSKKIFVSSINNMNKYRKKTKFILYWRPIVKGWNDDELSINRVLSLLDNFDAAVIKGLRLHKENYNYMISKGIELHYESQYEKVFPKNLENQIREAVQKKGILTPILNKTSCAISTAFGIGDYNKQYGRIDCSNCSEGQQQMCKNIIVPSTPQIISNLFNTLNLKYNYKVFGNTVHIFGITKEEKWFLQHIFNSIIE